MQDIRKKTMSVSFRNTVLLFLKCHHFWE